MKEHHTQIGRTATVDWTVRTSETSEGPAAAVYISHYPGVGAVVRLHLEAGGDKLTLQAAEHLANLLQEAVEVLSGSPEALWSLPVPRR